MARASKQRAAAKQLWSRAWLAKLFQAVDAKSSAGRAGERRLARAQVRPVARKQIRQRISTARRFADLNFKSTTWRAKSTARRAREKGLARAEVRPVARQQKRRRA
jgi:hypothetical protein